VDDLDSPDRVRARALLLARSELGLDGDDLLDAIFRVVEREEPRP
jgi:hypothetical protein